LKSVQPLFKINRFFLNVLIVLQLELKPDSFSLGLLKVLLKFMNFLEKLFQTIFVFIILFNLDFNLLVTSLAFWLICIQLLFNLVTGDFSIFCWYQNRDKWFHIFPYSLCLNFRISEPFSWLRPTDNSSFFDDNWLLNHDPFMILWFDLPGNFYLFVRSRVANILLDQLLL
jgi:hypothetical protein